MPLAPPPARSDQARRRQKHDLVSRQIDSRKIVERIDVERRSGLVELVSKFPAIADKKWRLLIGAIRSADRRSSASAVEGAADIPIGDLFQPPDDVCDCSARYQPPHMSNHQSEAWLIRANAASRFRPASSSACVRHDSQRPRASGDRSRAGNACRIEAACREPVAGRNRPRSAGRCRSRG